MIEIITNVFDVLVDTLQHLVNLPFGLVGNLSSALGV